MRAPGWRFWLELSAARVHVDGVERRMSADEQTVAGGTTKADIGDFLRHRNLADQIAARGEALHAVAGARPDIAVDVDPESIGNARRHVGQNPAVPQPAVVGDIEAADVMGRFGIRPEAEIGDVEMFSSGEKARPFGREKSSTTIRRAAIPWIEAIDVATADLAVGLSAFVFGADPVGRVGEPDRAVGMDDDVIGRIQPFAVEFVDQDRDLSIQFGARHAPPAMFAGDKPALPVSGVAVGEIRIAAGRR